MARKKKKTLTDAEIAQAVADAADAVERGGRSNGIRIGDSRFHLEGRQLGTETTETCDARILLRGAVSVSDTYRIPILLGYTSDTYPSRTKKTGYFMVGILVSDTVVST
jgi:hypothetical protein